jgi:hypothetical protein
MTLNPGIQIPGFSTVNSMRIELDAWELKIQTKAEGQPPQRIPTRGTGPLCGRRLKAVSFVEAGFRPEFEVLLLSI